MGIITRFGHWLDTRFPEKISADIVHEKLERYFRDLSGINQHLTHVENITTVQTTRIEALEAQLKMALEVVGAFKDDMNKVKTIMQVKQSGQSRMPNLTGSEAWKR